MAIAERLAHSRKRVGLKLNQVNKRTGIGMSSLSEFENNKRQPSLSQLQTLAALYRRSVAYFLAEGEIERETVLWREKPKEDYEQMEVKFLHICERYHNLEVWTEEKQPTCLPVVIRSSEPFSYLQAEILAKRVRDTLNLGDRPGLSLLSVLEEVCGVKVFHLQFEPTGPAASTLSETFGPAILLNSGNVRWRRNFDLAHELFHLLTWTVFRTGGDGATSLTASEEEEKFANAFASHLLLPDEAVRMVFAAMVCDKKMGYGGIYDIARQFDVSAKAMLWRLFKLKLLASQITPEKVKGIASELGNMNQIYEDRQDIRPPKWPERYKALAMKALNSGQMSIGRFAEYLEITRQAAMKHVSQEPMDGQEIPIALA